MHSNINLVVYYKNYFIAVLNYLLLDKQSGCMYCFIVAKYIVRFVIVILLWKLYWNCSCIKGSL